MASILGHSLRLSLLLAASWPGLAQDAYDPGAPTWRMSPGATFQKWSFSSGYVSPSAPETWFNPQGTPLCQAVAQAPGKGWVDTRPAFGTNQGTWDLGPAGTLTLTIPNRPASAPAAQYLLLQVAQVVGTLVYTNYAGLAVAGATCLNTQRVTIDAEALAGAWVVDETLWRLDSSPALIAITLSAGAGGAAIGQVIADVGTIVNYTVTGTLALEKYVGPNGDGRGARLVTFKATDAGGSNLRQWDLTLTFAPGGDGFGVAPFTLADVPAATFGISAKTDWNQRRKLYPVFSAGAAVLDFTGASQLRAGDLNGDNAVDALDMGLLFDHWYTRGPAGDFNGDGGVDALDMGLLFDNWYTAGDPE